MLATKDIARVHGQLGWAVDARITEAAKRTSSCFCCFPVLSDTFLRKSPSPSSSPYQICPNRVSQLLLLPRFLSFSAHHKNKYNHVFLPANWLPSAPCARSLLFCSRFCTVLQQFDELPQREGRLEDSHLRAVLGVIKSDTIRSSFLSIGIGHCLALKIGVLAHLPVSTSLLTAYSRARDFGSSWALFNEILDGDVIIWNAMITASLDNRCFGTAVNLFAKMIREGNGFDSTTLLLVASALSHMNDSRNGRILHGLSLTTGMFWDSFLCNALVDMYAKCSDLNSAECVFEMMECRDIVTWNSIMSGCLYNNCPEKLMWYFREMSYLGEVPDDVTLSCAISASACLGNMDLGELIHSRGIKLGFDESSKVLVSNSLISLYSHCGDCNAAETVFRCMITRDVVSWNAMIDGFASSGKMLEAFDLLHEMQSKASVQPDSVTVITIIPLCAESMLLREGRTIHGLAIRRAMRPALSVMNSLMDMYSKCYDMNSAELLFKSTPERDLISWNTMLSGYSQNGRCGEAQYLFKELLICSLHYSLSTVLAILSSCNSADSLEFGRSIHGWQLKLGFSYNICVVNSLMLMYINCGDVIASFSLLQRILHVADIASWNTVIAGCAQNCHFWETLETFNLMRLESHLIYDSITLFNVVLACGNLKLLFEGKFLHGLALKTSIISHTHVQNALITMYGRCGDIESARSVFGFSQNRTLCSWNCMISVFSQNKDGRRVLELFHCLDFEPNEITIVGILSACSQLGVIRHGKQIQGRVFRLGFHRNAFITAALIDMYSSCGKLDAAVQIFQNSPERSVAAWNCMISAYGLHGNASKAIKLFHDMCDSGTKPTKSTFISLLSACSHSGLIKEGLWYYKCMWEVFGVEPVTEHQVCIVDMLGRSGRLHEAWEFIERMPIQPKPGVWGALLSACNYHGDIEMGIKVVKILFGLEPDNVGYYISLSNAYVAAGRWDDAVELRKKTQDKQLKKPAGYSRIDVDLR
ncbi:pentatricopeptide repeat-containing protein At4g19220, mitochondrial [Malania oleifera]|uniref:pentatricopeptide repeat-containing protein At4g19220, mitochondrial n=1 Tax=Malania oleifera TaxID=397392 RepID=UPI0025AE5370|nr:pentatricopeptide repeat-containing protein At4g19220, mitochondrial [Malania oleifera]